MNTPKQSLTTSNTQRTRRRRKTTRLFIAVVALIALVAGAIGVRAVLKAQAVQSARARGLKNFHAGEYALALSDLSVAAGSDKSDAAVLSAFGETRLQTSAGELRHLQLAMRSFRAALAAGAPKVEQLEGVMRAAERAGLTAEALEAADEILAVEPAHRRSILVKALTLVSRGKLDEARRLLEGAILATPADLTYRIALIECLRREAKPSAEILARVDQWLNEADPIDGLRELRASIEFEAADALTTARRDLAERIAQELSALEAPRDAEIARMRGMLLARIGHVEEARAVIDAGRTLAPTDEGLATMAFALRVYAGELDDARAVLLSYSIAAPKTSVSARAETVMAGIVIAATDTRAVRDACDCGIPVLSELARAQLDRAPEHDESRVPREVAAQLVAWQAACVAFARNDVDAARVLFLQLFRASGSQWRLAGVYAARALASSGRLRESLEVAQELAVRWPLDQRVREELLHARTAILVAGNGSVVGVDADALRIEAQMILDQEGASATQLVAAVDVFAACGSPEELARAISVARDRGGDAWGLSKALAVHARRTGDSARALEVLIDAADNNPEHLAYAALLADELRDPRTRDLCMRSLPLAVTMIARTRCAREDRELAPVVLAQLKTVDAPAEVAIFSLAIAQNFPTLMSRDSALAAAESLRRSQGDSARLLFAMADLLGSGSTPEFPVAAVLYQQAAKLDPDSSYGLIAAARAASGAGDKGLLAQLATQLLARFSNDAGATRTAIAALAEAGESQQAADAAMRLARTTFLDSDVALAAKALAAAGDRSEALRLLDSALAADARYAECAQLRAVLTDASAPATPSTQAALASPELRALCLAAAGESVEALQLQLNAFNASELSEDLRTELLDALRDAVLRRTVVSDAALAAIASIESARTARAAELARASFDPSAAAVSVDEARMLAIELKDDWCAWIAAIRAARRASDAVATAEIARAAFAAMPTEQRLLRDGIDALLADPLGDALGNATSVVAACRASGSSAPTLQRAAATIALARGDGLTARSELDGLEFIESDLDLRVLRDQALLLSERFDDAARCTHADALVNVARMLSPSAVEKFADAVERAQPKQVWLLASLRAEVALRAPSNLAAAERATVAARAAADATTGAVDQLAMASAAMSAACAGGDAIVITRCRDALVTLLPEGVGALLDPAVVRPTGWERAAAPMLREIAAQIVAEEARAQLMRTPDRCEALARHAYLLAPNNAELAELFALAIVQRTDSDTTAAAALIQGGSATVERLIARGRVALSAGNLADAREHLIAARRARAQRAFAAGSLNEAIEALAEGIEVKRRNSKNESAR